MKSIILKPWEVRAVLDGRKTRFSRPMKPNFHPQQIPEDEDMNKLYGKKFSNIPQSGRYGFCEFGKTEDDLMAKMRPFCPFGKVGDRLWVKETFRVGAWQRSAVIGEDRDAAFVHPKMALDYRSTPEIVRTPWLCPPLEDYRKLKNKSVAEATEANKKDSERWTYDGVDFGWKHGDSPCKWQPSTRMPQWASRLTLEITDNKVQRVQDLTEEEATAEGAEWLGHFSNLWSQDFGIDLWNSNTWIWAVSFKVVK